ncbi:MAG: metal-dependent hydrolase [Gammaproteobacteria bacterium]|nr:metal-dependent hydrolase [Gammaproteobacteria bacterium]
MDSVTQLLLGAATAEASAGRQIGRRAALWGAVCGTLPDLDVLVPLSNAISDFTYHRSASHSLLVLAIITPLIVWLIRKLHPDISKYNYRLHVMVYLAFATHVLLDSFTVYGTQIFWPIVTTPMTWSTIFIIDPAYTIPLLIGVLTAQLSARKKSFGRAINLTGLAISNVYLLWSLTVKLHVDAIAHNTLENVQINASSVLTTPAPFNTLLWRVLAVNEDYYFEGYYSIFDESQTITFKQYPRSLHLLQAITNNKSIQRLEWFTKDFYAASLQQDRIIVSDLRMGSEPDYVFKFAVAKMSNPHPQPILAERVKTELDLQGLKWVWARIWDSETAISIVDPN